MIFPFLFYFAWKNCCLMAFTIFFHQFLVALVNKHVLLQDTFMLQTEPIWASKYVFWFVTRRSQEAISQGMELFLANFFIFFSMLCSSLCLLFLLFLLLKICSCPWWFTLTNASIHKQRRPLEVLLHFLYLLPAVVNVFNGEKNMGIILSIYLSSVSFLKPMIFLTCFIELICLLLLFYLWGPLCTWQISERMRFILYKVKGKKKKKS